MSFVLLSQLLSIAVGLMEDNDKEKCWEVMEGVRRYCRFAQEQGTLDETELYLFRNLYSATAISVSVMGLERTSESGMIERFRENLERYIPGAKWVDGPKSQQHTPDAWLMIRGKLYPVEAKRKIFNQKAIGQLSRYMNHFGCDKGFAVAPSLKGVLGPGMRFIKCD